MQYVLHIMVQNYKCTYPYGYFYHFSSKFWWDQKNFGDKQSGSMKIQRKILDVISTQQLDFIAVFEKECCYCCFDTFFSHIVKHHTYESSAFINLNTLECQLTTLQATLISMIMASTPWATSTLATRLGCLFRPLWLFSWQSLDLPCSTVA
jgi:hypothetical protein